VEVLRFFFNLINNCLLHSGKFYLKPRHKKSIENSIKLSKAILFNRKLMVLLILQTTLFLQVWKYLIMFIK